MHSVLERKTSEDMWVLIVHNVPKNIIYFNVLIVGYVKFMIHNKFCNIISLFVITIDYNILTVCIEDYFRHISLVAKTV